MKDTTPSEKGGDARRFFEHSLVKNDVIVSNKPIRHQENGAIYDAFGRQNASEKKKRFWTILLTPVGRKLSHCNEKTNRTSR